MDTSDFVSVVITTYNRSDALLAVLRGLVRQTDRNFEVIVADDGSRAEHRQALLESPVAQQLKVAHVWHPDVGFTASRVRNRGVASTRADYLILLDGDCIPEVDFIARHKRLAQTGMFVNGSRVFLSPTLTQQVIAGQVSVSDRSGLFWLRQRALGNASKWGGRLRLPDWSMRLVYPFVWRGIRSCNMGVWRADYEAVDGFDESFDGWGHEDADFVLRLHNSGLTRKNGFCATEVYHLWHAQASREHESRNALTVRERMQTGIVRAKLGFAQKRERDDSVITRLG
jgi:glycosyltransferase involved in cell wall biosynthesis